MSQANIFDAAIVTVYGSPISDFSKLNICQTENFLVSIQAFSKWKSITRNNFSVQPSIKKCNVQPANKNVLLKRCCCKAFSDCQICYLDTAFSRPATNFHLCKTIHPCFVALERLPRELPSKTSQLDICTKSMNQIVFESDDLHLAATLNGWTIPNFETSSNSKIFISTNDGQSSTHNHRSCEKLSPQVLDVFHRYEPPTKENDFDNSNYYSLFDDQSFDTDLKCILSDGDSSSEIECFLVRKVGCKKKMTKNDKRGTLQIHKKLHGFKKMFTSRTIVDEFKTDHQAFTIFTDDSVFQQHITKNRKSLLKEPVLQGLYDPDNYQPKQIERNGWLFMDTNIRECKKVDRCATHTSNASKSSNITSSFEVEKTAGSISSKKPSICNVYKPTVVLSLEVKKVIDECWVHQDENLLEEKSRSRVGTDDSTSANLPTMLARSAECSSDFQKLEINSKEDHSFLGFEIPDSNDVKSESLKLTRRSKNITIEEFQVDFECMFSFNTYNIDGRIQCPKGYNTKSTMSSNRISTAVRQQCYDIQQISRTFSKLNKYAASCNQKDFHLLNPISDEIRRTKLRTKRLQLRTTRNRFSEVLEQCLLYKKQRKIDYGQGISSLDSDKNSLATFNDSTVSDRSMHVNIAETTTKLETIESSYVFLDADRVRFLSKANTKCTTLLEETSESVTFMPNPAIQPFENEEYSTRICKPNSLVCSLCKIESESFESLICHIDSHMKQKIYLCYYCQRRSGTNSDRKKHMRSHTGEKSYVCNICNKAFSLPGNRNKHQECHNMIKNFKCNVCSKRFRRSAHLTTHMLVHSGEKSHICSFCGKSFGRKFCLNLHMNLHTSEKLYLCRFCEKPCYDKSTLTKHERRHTGEKPYMCLTCGKRFTDNSSLSVHLSSHSDDRPFLCKICSVSFKTYGSLSKHAATHSDVKKCQCKKCGKKFRTTSNLKIHETVHQNEFPFHCDHCALKFRRKGSLAKHMVIHTRGSDKPLKCEACPSAFYTKKKLELHVDKIHRGFRKFGCNICEKLFASKNSLKKHISTFHETGARSFLCKWCNKVFKREIYVTKHDCVGRPEIKDEIKSDSGSENDI